ncbi:hypothetical protein GLU64_02810 [Nanohaloarchaea archaeon]|nr:hypothetical protein [Candidatus Nanohaloarchaea archaeon]
MSFLLDFMENLKPDEEGEDDTEGFPDMNYVVGNTSGMDVGNIPAALGQRIGDQAQLGGSVMEVQIYNPSTFKIEKEEIYSSVQQLGLDISLHSEPNLGFASAYKTRGQQAQGFETAQAYFKRYLNQLAIFKKEKHNRDDLDFEITRINPHMSTSPIPALQERMASDVGLDIFGYPVNEYDDSAREQRNRESQNIYANNDFLRRMYYTFVKKRAVNQEFQLFNSFFSRYSDKFDRIFRDAKRKAADEFYDRGLEDQSEDERLEIKIALVSTAQRQDFGVEGAWLDILEEEFDEPVELKEPIGEEDPRQPTIETVENLSDVDDLLQQSRLTLLNRLSSSVYKIENKEFPLVQSESDKEEIKEKALDAINKKLDKLWRGNGDKFLISVQGKIGALQNYLDINQQRIVDQATQKEAVDFDRDNSKIWTLDEAAEEVMVGNPEFFQDIQGAEVSERYDQMLKFIFEQFQQAMWMESNLFYFIIPAWMTSADYSNDRHSGWDSPKFIWKTLVLDRWGDEYDIDLKNPGKQNGYFEALENSREFREDVAGAVGACYVWGHFTQKKSDFEISGEDHVDDDSGKYTFVEWMNKYGIGVNFEAMDGDPQQRLKVWKPRHIVAGARAINMTARRQARNQGLGGRDEINPVLDECPAKFTIDMEHTASFGVNPWSEMSDLIEQETRIAERNDFDAAVNEDKPLAKILRNYHLMKPGVESQRGSRHGPFDRGDMILYRWLFKLVEAGFTRNPEEKATVMYEQGDEKAETTYMARITMDMIELGIEPENVDPVNVSTDGDYDSREEALIAKFFGIDESSTAAEWAKIEQHAFDPLDGLLEAEQFDYTFSSVAALSNDNNPRDFQNEEYR